MLQTLPFSGGKSILEMKNYFLVCDVDENWVIEGSHEHIRGSFFIEFVYHAEDNKKKQNFVQRHSRVR
jgi:hypothetical protein